MSIQYFELSYPNFVLGAIIDPEEANQNNFDISTKLNGLVDGINANESTNITLGTEKATIVYVDGKISNLAGVGRVSETIKLNAANLITHKASNDHDSKYYTKILMDAGQMDSRYYTETEINSTVATLATKVENNLKANSADVYSKASLNAGQLDNRYYTQAYLVPWLRGGDTSVKEEVFTIINSNLGDETFSYSVGAGTIIGSLGLNGEQIFTLNEGVYEVGTNRIEAIINDTLRRSVASGGLLEVDINQVALTSPEGSGAEITVKYFERLGMAAEYNIKMSAVKPPANNGKTMWFKEL